MKFDLKGIRFNTWLYFFLFSLTILLVLGILQISLIKPYYRNDRIRNIELIAGVIENDLLKNNINSSDDVDATFDLILNNNVCAVVYNDRGHLIYESDALGATCIFDKETTIEGKTISANSDPKSLIALLDDDGNLSASLTSSVSGQEMLLYGKMVNADLANYYLFINSPVEPIESYVQFFMNQYLFIAIPIFILAIIISLVLAKRIAAPISEITKEANKLQNGDYSARFEGGSFSEINDLALTLNKTGKRLEVIDELRKDLIANVSHDIKTPLTMIKAYAEMIRDISGEDAEKRNEHLKVIIEEADYLDRLVDDMREVSKLQAGQASLHRTNFDMKETILRIIKHYQGIFTDSGLKLKTELTTSVVWADETAMSRVINNFLSNAIKYSFDDSTVTIRMIDSEDHLRVEVSDDGKGIAESELPYIWTRYYKIDKSFTRNSNSTGLGLAIAKAILEAHGAKYGVISKVNVGSTFYFELSKDYDEERLSE